MRFIPRHNQYFDLFEKQAAVIAACVPILEGIRCAAMADQKMVADAQLLEGQCDTVTGKILYEVKQDTITPLDPEDISTLARQMDDVVDLVEEVVIRLGDYHLAPGADLQKFLGIASQSLTLVSDGVMCLRKRSSVEKLRTDMKALEHDADKLVRRLIADSYELSVADVLQKEKDAPVSMADVQRAFTAYMIKRKCREVSEKLEELVDACEHVYHTLGNIYLK